MSNFADDIRRIAGKDKQKNALGPKNDRDPIFGRTTPFNDDSFSKETEGVDEVETDDCATDVADESAPIDPSDPANTFGSTSNSGGERADAEDIYTGDYIEGGSSGGDYDPFNSGNALGGVDGLYSCTPDSGGGYRKYDVTFGSFPSVDGWDDPEDPPIDDNWESGYFWCHGSCPGVYRESTPDLSYALWEASIDWNTWSIDVPFAAITATHWQVTIRSGGTTQQHDFYRCTCAGSVEAANPICTITEAPLSEECWASDGITQLALIDGQYVASAYDCNDNNSFEPVSTLNLCAGLNGEKPVAFHPAKDGGSVIESEKMYIFKDKGGKPYAFSDKTEANYKNYGGL